MRVTDVATAHDPQSHEPADSGRANHDLLEALRAELTEERARKDSLERRGLAVAAGATTSLALLLGLGSRYTGKGETWFFLVLGAGSLSFLVSALYAWRTSRALEYSEIALSEFKKILEKGWTEGSEEEFRLFLADGVYETIVDARNRNNAKVADFERALRFLLAGAVFVVVGIGFVVVDRAFF